MFAHLRRSCYRVGMLVARSRLARDLENLGLGPGGVTMVHCRMSALGHVVGGAETVVRALLDAVGPGGTLMAYTGWQDEPPDDLDELDEESKRIYLEEHRVRVSGSVSRDPPAHSLRPSTFIHLHLTRRNTVEALVPRAGHDKHLGP